MIDEDDRRFTLTDLIEIVVLVAVLAGLFWLLDSLNPWLKIPAILLGTLVVLIGWRSVRKLLERKSGRSAAGGDSAANDADGAEPGD